MSHKKEENLFVINYAHLYDVLCYTIIIIKLFCIFPFADKCQKTTYYGV